MESSLTLGILITTTAESNINKDTNSLKLKGKSICSPGLSEGFPPKLSNQSNVNRILTAQGLCNRKM